MKLTLLDSLDSWELIYVHFNTIQVERYEGNHSEDRRNIKLAQ